MKKITLLAAFVMALFVLAGCQASVNTIENAVYIKDECFYSAEIHSSMILRLRQVRPSGMLPLARRLMI